MDEALLREALVHDMERQGSMRSGAVERAFLHVPRHRFVPGVTLAEAYADRAISIKSAQGQTLASISQPSMLARMLELGRIESGNRALEIGSGSGYNAALLSELVGPDGIVVSIEVENDLAACARAVIESCNYTNVRVLQGDGYRGYAASAPYDCIVISARAHDIPGAWWEQLAEDGRLVVPLDVGVGGEYAVGFVRSGPELHSIGALHCLFLPLRGEENPPTAERVFVRSRGDRYSSRPREIARIVAVKTKEARPELLERADVVVAQPYTTFAISWD